MNFQNYTIKPVTYQGTRCYKVTPPAGDTFRELAANLATAKKWIALHAAERLQSIRRELKAERISYGELHELQSLIPHIKPGDLELLEAAGVPEAMAQKWKGLKQLR